MNKSQTIITQREYCYKCYRPSSSCMCKYTNKINTNTKFVILMHPKEFKKTKNKTGHFTKNSLSNSELFIGIDFTENKKINEIIKNNECYLLYPSVCSVNLSKEKLNPKKNIAIFIIDSTWACSKKIIKTSKNLQNLKMLSFDVNKQSAFSIKKQPSEYCLSTIESTQYLIFLLNENGIENINKKDLQNMTKPFEKMVQYQISCVTNKKNLRIKTL